MSAGNDSVVILGVYGKGNFGDEALLEVVANDVRQVLPSCEIYVFCSGPEAVRTRFGFPALTRTPTSDFRRKLGLVRRSRLVVVGGGTLLCDHGGGFQDALDVMTFFSGFGWHGSLACQPCCTARDSARREAGSSGSGSGWCASPAAK